MQEVGREGGRRHREAERVKSDPPGGRQASELESWRDPKTLSPRKRKGLSQGGSEVTRVMESRLGLGSPGSGPLACVCRKLPPPEEPGLQEGCTFTHHGVACMAPSLHGPPDLPRPNKPRRPVSHVPRACRASPSPGHLLVPAGSPVHSSSPKAALGGHHAPLSGWPKYLGGHNPSSRGLQAASAAPSRTQGPAWALLPRSHQSRGHGPRAPGSRVGRGTPHTSGDRGASQDHAHRRVAEDREAQSCVVEQETQSLTTARLLPPSVPKPRCGWCAKYGTDCAKGWTQRRGGGGFHGHRKPLPNR